MRGTPLSPPSAPKWASAGTYTTTHISRIKNLHMQYFGVLLAFPVTDISHYLWLMSVTGNASSVSSSYCSLNCTASAWQGSGMFLRTCEAFQCIQTGVLYYLILSLSHVGEGSQSICMSVWIWHIFLSQLRCDSLLCVCVTVVAGTSQWQARVLIWYRVSPCRWWELDIQWVS